VVAVVLLLLPATNAAAVASIGAGAPAESALLEASEMMPAFLNGHVVNTVYEQGYFVGTALPHNSTFGGEPLSAIPSVGTNPTVFPSSKISVDQLWILVPWWGPNTTPYLPAFDPAMYHIQMHCAPATVAVCWDHPATIRVPGLGIVPLPGHDHLIASQDMNKDIWWQVLVDLVTNQSVWPNLAATSGITSLTALRTAQSAGQVSADLPTDLFLDFRVLGNLPGKHIQQAESDALDAAEAMPVFVHGTVHQSFYEQGYFTGGNVSYKARYGGEPLLAPPEAGTAATTYPADPATIQPFYVLVPWFGPSSAPYDPAYHPANYGIRLQCAPATISVCFDHPATINVSGLGIVPLPGHDHLIGDVAGHRDIWWNVVVVLVLNQSYFPNLSGTHGITSVSALTAAQAAGAASSGIPTNVFLQFWVGELTGV
jgi:hypothetical protein